MLETERGQCVMLSLLVLPSLLAQSHTMPGTGPPGWLVFGARSARMCKGHAKLASLSAHSWCQQSSWDAGQPEFNAHSGESAVIAPQLVVSLRARVLQVCTCLYIALCTTPCYS